jgi:hypothetical protein
MRNLDKSNLDLDFLLKNQGGLSQSTCRQDPYLLLSRPLFVIVKTLIC